MTQVFGNTVGQRPFELIPDKLIGIKFRSITGKPVDIEAGVFCQEFFDHPSLMRSAIVPEQDDGFAQMPPKVLKKPRHLGGTDVFIAVELGIKGDLSSFRGNRERRNGRDFGPASGDTKMGGLSFWCPCANDVRHQEKTAFIQEDQISPQLLGFFLYGATPSASSDRWRIGSFPGLVSLASDNSSPDESETATGDWSGTSHRIPSRLPEQPSFGSTGRWKNPRSKLLSKESWLISSSGWSLVWEGDQEQAWVLRHPDPPLCIGPSTGLQNCGKSLSFAQQPTRLNHSPAAGGHVGGAVPVAFGFQKVSCI